MSLVSSRSVSTLQPDIAQGNSNVVTMRKSYYGFDVAISPVEQAFERTKTRHRRHCLAEEWLSHGQYWVQQARESIYRPEGAKLDLQKERERWPAHRQKGRMSQQNLVEAGLMLPPWKNS